MTVFNLVGYNYAARNRGRHKVFVFILINMSKYIQGEPPQGIVIVFLCQEQGKCEGEGVGQREIHDQFH